MNVHQYQFYDSLMIVTMSGNEYHLVNKIHGMILPLPQSSGYLYFSSTAVTFCTCLL